MVISTYEIGHNKITVVVGNDAEAAFPIGSVLFYMDDDLRPAIENKRPYSFKGDRKRGGSINYKPWSTTTGTHRLRVEYWQGKTGSGSLLHSIDVTFTVVDAPLVHPEFIPPLEFIHADLNRETTATAVPDGASGQSAAIATAVVVLAVLLVIGAAINTGRRLRSRQAGEAENDTFVQHDCIEHSPAEHSPAATEMNAIQAEDGFYWDDMT